MSYFAEANFIKYDKWFDDDLVKTKNDIELKKLKTTSKVHDFYYEQSKYKIGGSENTLQLEIKVNDKELISNNFFENYFEKYNSVLNKKFPLFKKFTKSKLKFNITKKLIYSLSIFGCVLIIGLMLFLVSQSKKNESKITTRTLVIEKGF